MNAAEVNDRIVAAANLVGRTGAREFEIGYLREDVPPEEAGWYAQASYRGTRVIADDHASPVDAMEALVRKLLTGARCSCGKLVALGREEPSPFASWAMSDGTEFPVERADATGLCVWERKGARWWSACGRGGQPT